MSMRTTGRTLACACVPRSQAAPLDSAATKCHAVTVRWQAGIGIHSIHACLPWPPTLRFPPRHHLCDA
eukprot:6826824-Prorocentrum_lima.AAC.1